MESRFWIVKDGIKVFGRGPCILLKTIDRFGSLNRAAKELNMSYSKAWTIVRRAEKALGYSLLRTETGGAEGGGSHLTSQAKKLIRAYEEFSKKAEGYVEKSFIKYFSDL